MAVNPHSAYPTKTTAPTAEYPYGGAQNITTPGDGTGTPWIANLINDIFGFQQALLSEAGIVPNGSPDTAVLSQYLQALKAVAINHDLLASKIQPIEATTGTNTLIITLNPTSLDFRSTTLNDGAVTTVSNDTAITLTVPAGATIGTTAAISARLAVVAINNDGTMELAIVNTAGGNDLSETGLISTTVLDTASNANNVFYSTTARTNVAYRVVGLISITEATAGTWATAPTLVQGAGGEAISSLNSFGVGQAWTDVTGSRVNGTTYTNSTGKPIEVRVTVISGTGVYGHFALTVGGVVSISKVPLISGTNVYLSLSSIVPNGSTYRVDITSGSISSWGELR